MEEKNLNEEINSEDIENVTEETKQEEQEISEKPKKEKSKKKNQEIEELRTKVNTLEEETLRAKADLINYRKRKDEEVANLLKYANSDLIMSLLPVLDNFERALESKNESEELNNYLEGFRLIYENIKEILKANGVSEIEALGKEFDPLYHHSISMRKDESKESGIVLEVYQKGYTYKDKILRPSKVIINE